MEFREHHSAVDASPGAEVWAWFNGSNHTKASIDQQWKDLCGVLSGLLCASLNFIDESNTIEPEFTFRPQFSPGTGRVSPTINTGRDYRVRYATLPREVVCTENLTPWKKLLPGDTGDGIMSLLNSAFIHATNYYSLGLHIRRLKQQPLKAERPADADNLLELLEFKQTVSLVFDSVIVTNGQEWSLRKLFGQGCNRASELASSTNIYVDVSDADFTLTPEPSRTITSQRGGAITRLAVYDVKSDFARQMFSIAAVRQNGDADRPLVSVATPPPPLYAKRYVMGVGQQRGQIVTKVTNNHWTALNVVLLENVPWFVPIYLHTLAIRVNGADTELKPQAVKYVPGKMRVQPSQLEVAFTCPARSVVDVAIDFDYVFLKWTEYPPDANHGYYLGSAVLVAQLPVARNFTAIPIDGILFADSFNASRMAGYLVNIRTESLLITLPTPDFSMPYNVICLACTVVALAFGPIHNYATKKLSVKKPEDLLEQSSGTVLDKVKAMIPFFKRRAD